MLDMLPLFRALLRPDSARNRNHETIASRLVPAPPSFPPCRTCAMTQSFSPEFVDAFLFKNGLELKNYVIHRTPVSEIISCVSDDSEFDLLISDNALWRLAKLR